MYKSKYQSRVMGALLLVLTLAVSAQASPFTAPKKLADYLYYMEYTDYVSDLATGENIKQGFACSSVHNGNFYGRNLDLDYSNVPEFVTKVTANESEDGNDLANRTLRLNIQEDYSKHYDFKLN